METAMTLSPEEKLALELATDLIEGPTRRWPDEAAFMLSIRDLSLALLSLALAVSCRPQRGFRADAQPRSRPLVPGQPVKKSYCIYGTYSDIGIQSPDVVELLLDFEDRCTANVHLDFFQSPRRRQIELIGTSGVILVEFARWERCKLSVYELSSKLDSRGTKHRSGRHVPWRGSRIP